MLVSVRRCLVTAFVTGTICVGVLMRARHFVSRFKLAENFRFADDHRVEAAGNFEQVVQAVRLGEGIKFVTQRAIVSMMRNEKFF